MTFKNLSHYIDEYKKIQSASADNTMKKFKVAVLSSSTIKGLKEVLTVKCHDLGLFPEILLGEYNQYNQEILDDESKLYRFEPNLVVLFIDTRALLGDVFFDYYTLSAQDQKCLPALKKEYLDSLIARMKFKLKAKIIIHNFELPCTTPLGILENKQALGLVEFIETLNGDLRDGFKSDSQVFVFDYNSFLSNIGKREAFNYKMYYLADIKIDLSYLPALADQYLAYIKPLISMTKKCIVLDLDNTLWGGIVGEDGAEGVKLGPTPEGRPFMEFQKYILSLFSRGVILAVNSNNNLDDVLEIFREHPYMILKEEHFASMKINWNGKVANMKAISEELNIGLDSFVFLDDDKFNREMIKSALPQVKVVNLPEDPSLYLEVITQLDDFNTFQITGEDMKKGQMYAQQKKREEFCKSAYDIKAYLKGLNIITTIQKANKFNVPRISQLTQKTNQFNLTTRRYLEEEIKQFSDSTDCIVFSIKVEDRFGDNGVTGAAIVKKKAKEWIVDSFLLSCREIGRGVEEVMLAHIFEEAKKEGIGRIIGEFIPTKKNEPAKDFYQKSGFILTEKVGDMELWSRDVAGGFPYPEFIEVIKAS